MAHLENREQETKGTRERVFVQIAAFASFALLLFTAGCRQDMQDQP